MPSSEGLPNKVDPFNLSNQALADQSASEHVLGGEMGPSVEDSTRIANSRYLGAQGNPAYFAPSQRKTFADQRSRFAKLSR